MPGEPDPVERDPKMLREIAERRVDMLSACDGLLLLGADDGRALDADLVVVGRQDRELARARSERLLPCAVLDTAGPRSRRSRRTGARARHRLDRHDPGHLDAEVRSWLIEASAAVERA